MTCRIRVWDQFGGRALWLAASALDGGDVDDGAPAAGDHTPDGLGQAEHRSELQDVQPVLDVRWCGLVSEGD
jgi:hypothetical protein